jgi:hypothetical protein
LNFLTGTKPVLDITGSAGTAVQKDSPLWFFPVADHLNTCTQITLLEEKIGDFHLTKDITVSYPRTIHIKMLEPFDLTESDAPGFMYLLSVMRVTLPYLLYREHSVTWPYIKGFSETLPLAASPRFTNDVGISINDEESESRVSLLQQNEPTTPTVAKPSSSKNEGSAKKGKANAKN